MFPYRCSLIPIFTPIFLSIFYTPCYPSNLSILMAVCSCCTSFSLLKIQTTDKLFTAQSSHWPCHQSLASTACLHEYYPRWWPGRRWWSGPPDQVLTTVIRKQAPARLSSGTEEFSALFKLISLYPHFQILATISTRGGTNKFKWLKVDCGQTLACPPPFVSVHP